MDHLPILTDAMQKWLLENYSFVSLAPFLTIKLKKNYKKNALTQARLVIIPEMKLYVHKKSGYDSRDDVMFTQKLRL